MNPPEGQPAPPAPPARDWLRLLRFATNGGYLILSAVTLAWGAWKRLSLQQAPIVDPDIRGYLGPALSALTGHGFIHYDGRSFPYPAFIWLLLRLFADFRAIAIVQHLLGIAAGVLTLLAWNAMLRLIPPGGIPREVSRYLGIAPAAVYLGSATAIHFEHEIRPEAIFPFLAILNLYLSFLFIYARFVRRRSASIWLGGLNVFIAFLIYLLKPSFGFATLFSTAPVWLSLLAPGAAPAQKGALLAACVLPAALLLFLPEQILKRNDVWGRQFLPETLFSVHSGLILDQISSDLATSASIPYPRTLLQPAHDLLQTDLQKAATITTPKAFPSLGYNPDYLMYDSFCPEFAKMTGWDPPELVKFYDYYYLRTVRRQPAAILKKITGQLRLFYCDKVPAYRLGQTMDLTDEYDRVEDLITKRARIGAGYAPLTPWFQECGALADDGAAFTQVKRLTEWTRLFSAHYLDLLLVALISPLVLFSCAFRGHLSWAVAALLLAYSYNFGNCLTIAIVHSLEVTRYVRIQLIFTIFAQCLSIYFVLEAITYGARLLIARRLHPNAS